MRDWTVPRTSWYHLQAFVDEVVLSREKTLWSLDPHSFAVDCCCEIGDPATVESLIYVDVKVVVAV